MGLPAKCTFCGVPGKEGGQHSPRDVKLDLPEFHAQPRSGGGGLIFPREACSRLKFELRTHSESRAHIKQNAQRNSAHLAMIRGKIMSCFVVTGARLLLITVA